LRGEAFSDVGCADDAIFLVFIAGDAGLREELPCGFDFALVLSGDVVLGGELGPARFGGLFALGGGAGGGLFAGRLGWLVRG
jgi:hypothetical protein